MKAVYDVSFKSSHALSGFEAYGLFLLNRDKISDEKLAIGTVFRADPQAEHETVDSISETQAEILFETPNKKQSTHTVKAMLKTVQSIIETSNKKAADSITKSVVNYLHENHLSALKNKQKRKLKSAATSSYILTEDKSREELASKEADKLRLVEEKKSRKENREANKKTKLAAKELAKQKRTEKRELSQQASKQTKKRAVKTKIVPLLNSADQFVNEVELKDRLCSSCNIEFQNDPKKSLWISCEAQRCRTWFCGNCFKGSSSSEFLCESCK